MTSPLDSSSNWCPKPFDMYCRWFSSWIVWYLYSLTLVLEGCTSTKVYSWEPWFSGTRFLPSNLNSHVKGTNPENLHVFNFKLSITPTKENGEESWKVISSWPKYKQQALSIMRHELKYLINNSTVIWVHLEFFASSYVIKKFRPVHTGAFRQYIPSFQNHFLDNWLLNFSCIINNYFFYNEFPWGCINFKGFCQRHKFLVLFWLL